MTTKLMKAALALFFVLATTFGARAYVLFEDSSNYPYANGCIEGQGPWYTASPNPQRDALVTNNVLLLYSNQFDSVEAPTNAQTSPTNGWINNDNNALTFASFRVMVTELPDNGDGDYFCEFRNNLPSTNANASSCCHVFVDTLGTRVPGTFRLGIANFATEFFGADSEYPPINYPEDLATDIWYTVVIAFGNQNAPAYAVGAALWVNPSQQDYNNYVNEEENDTYQDTNAIGNYVYNFDPSSSSAQDSILVGQIEFSQGSACGNEGVSNIIAGSEFADVFTTNLPVIGIQPYLYSTNYSTNNTTFYTVASGVDVTYQWFSDNYGKLTNGMNYTYGDGFFGATSNTLVVSNLNLTDTYYCVVTDAYGHTVTSSNAFEDVITTPTAPFFPASETNTLQTNNVFQSIDFQNEAKGTGPLYYQWYYAPTNIPTVYSLLVGSNKDYINLSLVNYLPAGSYYVVASNSVAGGSIAYCPTNTLVVLAPSVATLFQLNQLLTNFFATQSPIVSGTTYYLNQGGSNGTPITVGGYVTTWGVPIPGDTNLNGLAVGGLGNTYAEYFIEDTNGYGCEIYGAHETNNCQPPIGSYVTVSGPVEVYNCGLEIAPANVSAIVLSTNAPPYTVAPVLANSVFGQLATNMLGSTAVRLNETVVTFTNVYFYSSRLGAPISAGQYDNNGVYLANDYFANYFTVGGPYNPTNPATGLGVNPALPINTNMLEVFQQVYDYPYRQGTLVNNPFDNLPIPTNCYQFSGTYVLYGVPTAQAPEIIGSRVADYVLNPPPAFTASVGVTNYTPTISWTPQVGSTYTVNSATNLLGPWAPAAYGLSYYPTNGAFTDVRTKAPVAKFYNITSP